MWALGRVHSSRLEKGYQKESRQEQSGLSHRCLGKKSLGTVPLRAGSLGTIAMWKQDQNGCMRASEVEGHLALVPRPCSKGKGRVAGPADIAESADDLPISGRLSQAASCLRSSWGFL